eukprot:232887-Amphidinium_carterae.1
MGSSTNVGGSCGSYGSMPYGPDRNAYRRDFDLGPQLYGRYDPPNAGFVPQVRSVLAGNLPGSGNTANCPPGSSPCVAESGFQSPHSLSFCPPATCLDPLCAHPCSPSVHDCT